MNSSLRNIILGGATAITLTAAIGFGATASASNGDGSGSGPTGARAEKICTNLDNIDDWLSSRIAEVQHRIEYFTSMRAKAAVAGRNELVARIDTALARLNERLPRLQERLTKLDTWAAAHCTPAGEPTTTVASLGG